jgi:hypothetical protein
VTGRRFRRIAGYYESPFVLAIQEMNWRVDIRPEVELDMANAADWYNSRQPGLGA